MLKLVRQQPFFRSDLDIAGRLTYDDWGRKGKSELYMPHESDESEKMSDGRAWEIKIKLLSINYTAWNVVSKMDDFMLCFYVLIVT